MRCRPAWHSSVLALRKIKPRQRAFHMPAGVRLAGKISSGATGTAFRVVIGRHRDSTNDIRRSEWGTAANYFNGLAISTGKDNGQRKNLAEKKKLPQLDAHESQMPSTLPKDRCWRARLFELRRMTRLLLTLITYCRLDGRRAFCKRNSGPRTRRKRSKRGCSLPPLNIQYSDFAAWQKEWLASEESKKHREFWLSA